MISQKLKSRKLLIVVWAILIVSFWGTYSLMEGAAPAWMPGAIALLIAIPAGYVTIGTAKKKDVE